MGSSSSLRVLIVGNNPNVLLYTSRFQLAKSVDLYHVSDSKSSTFQVETSQYGNSTFQLENHFTSISHLIEAMTQSNEHPNPIFDLIILSASSLQEISTLASQLNPTININTKVFLESSGFVQLEPFVKMSMDLPNLNIFSILIDMDFRQIGNNEYKQFCPDKNGSTKCKIYLGESSLSKTKMSHQSQQQSNSKSSGTNSSSANQQSTKYPKSIISLLDTFQRLFQKLFPLDEVSLCNYSSSEFVSQQWALATPRICFDPLLILLEESHPSELQNQILAKPLISGLVTEIITVFKSMGSKLNGNLENESSLLHSWQKMYSNTNDVPALIYHFDKRTAPLNIDMLLLQPILLADDYGIKTPYLEFLYSLMCQYEKLNNGSSRWFIRREDNEDLEKKINLVSEERNQLQNKIVVLERNTRERDNALTELQQSKESSQKQIGILQSNLVSLKQEISMMKKKHDIEVEQLRIQESQKPEMSDGDTYRNFNAKRNTVLEDSEYASTGTPNLRDIEDFALIGVNYGETPQKQHLQQPSAPVNLGSSNSSVSNSGSGSGSGSGGPEVDSWLKVRELEIRKKELDLQERELELERKRVQHQQPQGAAPTQSQPQPHYPRYNKGKKHNGGPSSSPTLTTRKPSFPQLQQAALNGRGSSKILHGATPGPVTSANTFMDPLGPPMAGKANQVLPASSHFHQNGSHPIKPTSRKNRNSNMPLIGNASSLALTNFGRPPAGGQTPRLNSLSTGNLTMQGRMRQSSGITVNTLNNNPNPRINMPNAAKPIHGESPIPTHTQDHQPQRQFSSSTMILDSNITNPNISTNSVVHNPMTNNSNLSSTLADDSSRLQQSYNQEANEQFNDSAQTPQPQVPQIAISGPQSSPSLSVSSAAQSTSQAVTTNDEEENSSVGKKDKKKFGLFGKKKKKSKK